MASEGWPEFSLGLPRPIKAVAKFINHAIFGPHLFSEVSDHKFDKNRGAAPMIDRELYGELGETSEGIDKNY